MDIGVLIIVAVIVFFIFRSIQKLKGKKRKSDFIKANESIPMLREEAFRLNGQLQRCAEERNQRKRDVNAFCDFFEELGTDSAERLRSQENEHLKRQAATETALRRDYNSTLQKIEKAQRTVQRGWK